MTVPQRSQRRPRLVHGTINGRSGFSCGADETTYASTSSSSARAAAARETLAPRGPRAWNEGKPSCWARRTGRPRSPQDITGRARDRLLPDLCLVNASRCRSVGGAHAIPTSVAVSGGAEQPRRAARQPLFARRSHAEGTSRRDRNRCDRPRPTSHIRTSLGARGELAPKSSVPSRLPLGGG